MPNNSEFEQGYNTAIKDAIEALYSIPAAWTHPEYDEVYDIDINIAAKVLGSLISPIKERIRNEGLESKIH